MKTFTTTFSIIALLFSMNSFSFNNTNDITPPLKPRDPGGITNAQLFHTNNSFSTSSSDITPPLKPRDPGNGVFIF